MIETTPIRDPLDEFLREVVRALQAAVNRGTQSVSSDASVAEKTLEDCKEILDVIMAGHVKEWISTS